MDVCAGVSTGIEPPFLCFWTYPARKNACVGGIREGYGESWHGGTEKSRFNFQPVGEMHKIICYLIDPVSLSILSYNFFAFLMKVLLRHGGIEYTS